MRLVFLIAMLLFCMIWMNDKINSLEKELAIVKTVLIMKGIMPECYAHEEKK